jgi:transposase
MKTVTKKPAPEKRTRKRIPNNRTATGFRVSDELWAVFEPPPPEHVNTRRFGGGRPRVPDRACADAIFYVLRTGCQREALNQTDLCPKSTARIVSGFIGFVCAVTPAKLSKTQVNNRKRRN